MPAAIMKNVTGVTLESLARAVLTWASTPGEHGGNPYCHTFVKLARRAVGDDDERQSIADALCAILSCPRKGRHTERQLRALQRRHMRLHRRGAPARPCIGCHSGSVPRDQGSDYCTRCSRRDSHV